MSTTTMPSTVARTTKRQGEGVSHLLPLLVAIALLMASGVLAVLISGPMH